MTALFAVDIGFKFRLAFYDEELLVDDARAIAVRYLRCADRWRPWETLNLSWRVPGFSRPRSPACLPPLSHISE